MVTRRVSIFDPAVVTVGRITAGTTNNIIPAYAELEGTMRTLSDATRADVRRRIRQVLDGVLQLTTPLRRSSCSRATR